MLFFNSRENLCVGTGRMLFGRKNLFRFPIYDILRDIGDKFMGVLILTPRKLKNQLLVDRGHLGIRIMNRGNFRISLANHC